MLTGNGVAVIQNDQVDIWDWDNLGDECCPNWVLVPRKPQEQGTMVYNQANNTFVQTMPDGTVQTFGAPDPDADETTSPDDFGLLTTSVDAYGNTTSYYYQDDATAAGGVQLTSQIWTVGPDVSGRHSQEQIAYTVSGEKVTLGYTYGSSTDGAKSGTLVPGTGGVDEPDAVYWYTDGHADQTVGSATFVCNDDGDPELIETFDANGVATSDITGATYIVYYSTSDALNNDVQYVLGPDSLARLMAANSLTFSEFAGDADPAGALSSALEAGSVAANLASYADDAAGYYPASGSFDLMTSRVQSETVAGSGTSAYAYAVSTDPTEGYNYPDGINTWSVKETRVRRQAGL